MNTIHATINYFPDDFIVAAKLDSNNEDIDFIFHVERAPDLSLDITEKFFNGGQFANPRRYKCSILHCFTRSTTANPEYIILNEFDIKRNLDSGLFKRIYNLEEFIKNNIELFL